MIPNTVRVIITRGYLLNGLYSLCYTNTSNVAGSILYTTNANIKYYYINVLKYVHFI